MLKSVLCFQKEDEIARWKAKANPEDIEYYECQLELQQELVKSYNRVERIIGKELILNFLDRMVHLTSFMQELILNFLICIAEHKGADGQAEYYVKWESLSYAEATWENGALIHKRHPEVIQQFKKRDASTRIPSSSNKVLRTRPKFLPIKTQPSYMGGHSDVS